MSQRRASDQVTVPEVNSPAGPRVCRVTVHQPASAPAATTSTGTVIRTHVGIRYGGGIR